MCEPLTIAAIATIGAGMAVRATAASAQGSAAKFVAEQNADMSERQAADATARGLLPAISARMSGGRTIGLQLAHEAASGVLAGTGSLGDVTRETRIFSDLDEERIRNDAAKQALGYRSQAARYRQEGENAQAEANSAVLSSVIGGVGAMASIGAKAWLDRAPKGWDPANGPPPPDEE